MSRAIVLQGCVIVALTSCATISGLADKEAVDCPGDCDGGTPPSRPDASSGGVSDATVDTGPPKCNPATDTACMPLPEGWTLVARAELADGQPPACPSGTGDATMVKESPVAQAAACTCDVCTVTPAACSGQLEYRFATTATCSVEGDPNHYKNPVAGTCYQDLYTGDWLAVRNRFRLPDPSGGTCSVTPTVHADRFNYGKTSTICTDSSRCSGGFCDARIDAPFAVCVARSGDEACPAGFSVKHVVGSDGAEVTCGTCACTLNRGACQGAVHHYTDGNCLVGEVAIPANGNCGGPDTDNANFNSYKVVATSNTTCNTGGSTSATNARMKNPRTVCCRG